jgi:hypothetical protein
MKELLLLLTLFVSNLSFGQIYTQYGTIHATTTTNGNTGIGIIDPISKLQVIGDISSSGINQRIGFNTNDTFTALSNAIAHYGMSIYKDGNGLPGVSHSGFYGLYFYTNATERVRITSLGNVGIGTLNPDEKLAVKGKIHAEEVRVDLLVPADYVFQKYYTGKSDLNPEYVLPTLTDL